MTTVMRVRTETWARGPVRGARTASVVVPVVVPVVVIVLFRAVVVIVVSRRRRPPRWAAAVTTVAPSSSSVPEGGGSRCRRPVRDRWAACRRGSWEGAVVVGARWSSRTRSDSRDRVLDDHRSAVARLVELEETSEPATYAVIGTTSARHDQRLHPRAHGATVAAAMVGRRETSMRGLSSAARAPARRRFRRTVRGARDASPQWRPACSADVVRPVRSRMFVPFSVTDFIDRAVTVYGDRVGVVDEPDQPAPSLGDLTYAELGGARPAAGGQARRARPRGRRPGRGRLAQQRAAADVVLRRRRLRPRARAGQLPAPPRRGVLHRRALRRPRAATSTPSSTRRCPASPRSTASCSATTSDLFAARGRRAARLGARRERDGLHQLHLRHHRPTQGRADHPPQHLGQRRHLRDARRRHRPRRLPAHAADVPRQRLGDAVRDDRSGRPAGGAAQGRRRRDPAPGRATTASPSCAPRRPSPRPSSRPPQTWEGEIPGRDRVRIIMAGAPPPTKTVVRVEEELGWEFVQIYGLTETSPLLTFNRTRAEWDDLSAEERATRSWCAPGAPALGVRLRDRRARRGAGPLQRRPGGLLGAAGGVGDRALDGGWFHTGDGGVDRRRRLPHDQRPQEGRDHHRRRERLLDRGRGRALLPPGGRRGRRDRGAQREVGRDHQGARRARRGRGRRPRPS